MQRKVFISLVLALLPACKTVQLATPAGDTLRVQVPAEAAVGKIKAGTVIIQSGAGNQADLVDNRKAGQRQGAASTAPGAVASNAPTQRNAPLWALALLAVAGLAAGFWLRGTMRF